MPPGRGPSGQGHKLLTKHWGGGALGANFGICGPHQKEGPAGPQKMAGKQPPPPRVPKPAARRPFIFVRTGACQPRRAEQKGAKRSLEHAVYEDIALRNEGLEPPTVALLAPRSAD